MLAVDVLSRLILLMEVHHKAIKCLNNLDNYTIMSLDSLLYQHFQVARNCCLLWAWHMTFVEELYCSKKLFESSLHNWHITYIGKPTEVVF